MSYPWAQTLAMDDLPSARGWTSDVVGGQTATISNGILTTADTSTGGGTRSQFIRSFTAAEMLNCTVETRCRRTAGNNGASGLYLGIEHDSAAAYLELISTGLRWFASGATLAVDWASFHVIQFTKIGATGSVWVDGVNWLTGASISAGGVGNDLTFGAGASAQTGTAEWDWYRYAPGVAITVPVFTDSWLRDDSPMVMG